MAKKQVSDKPYLFPDTEKRITLEMKLERSAGKLYCVGVFLDGMLLTNLFCDRISVYLTEPPTYCLFVNDVNIAGFMTKSITVYPDAADAIPEQTRAALGKYLTLAEDKEGGRKKK